MLDPVTSYPVSWTGGDTITANIGFVAPLGSAKVPYGTWTLVYTDANYLSTPSTVRLTFSPGTYTGPTTTNVGTTVTQTYSWNGTGKPDYALTLAMTVESSDGLWHLSNIGVFVPGDTVDMTPFVVSDLMVNSLTGTDGTVPSHFRFMDSFWGTAWNNCVDVADIPPNTLSSCFIPYAGDGPLGVPGIPPNVGGALPSGTVPISSVRFCNTNTANSSTGNNTYPWPASTKLYSASTTAQPWALSGTDGVLGAYLDMTAGPLGANDNGRIVMAGGGGTSQGVVEFVCTTPHGFKTGQIIGFTGSFTATWSTGGSQTVTSGSGFNCFVTGPQTFLQIVNVPNAAGGGSGIQTITETSEVVVTNSFSLTQASISGSTVTYHGSSGAIGGPKNWLAGTSVTIAGFTNAGNNGTFTVTSSTSTTIVVTNASGVNETHAATVTTNGYATLSCPSVAQGLPYEVFFSWVARFPGAMRG